MKIRRKSIKAGYAVDDILWVLDGDDNTWKTWGSAGPKKKSMSKEELIDALNAEGNNYIDVLITKNGENPDDYGYTETIKDKFVKSGCTKKSVKSAKEIKRKPRNVQVYFWKNNAYNAVVMTDGEYWITFDESFDGIDLYDEDVIDELKSYIKTTDFNDFDDMYNQFANDENGNSPVVGDNFGAEFDSSELTKVGTVYEGKTNSACGKKSVKASAVMGAMDIENLTIYVPSYCYVDVMVDSYEQGEGEQVNSWTFQVADGFRTAQELIDDIAESSGIFSNDINDYVVLDSSLQTDATVNAENDIPTEEELEAWKRGELELYVAHLWVRLQVGSKTHDMTEDEAEAFGLSVY